MSKQDHLHKVDWIPIPNEPYLMKYTFSDTEYNIIVSNLMLIYSEKLTDFNIQERFHKLNPYARMKSQVILENLKKSLEKCLSEKSDLDMKLAGSKLCFTLMFPVAHVMCNFDIEMDLMTADKVMQYVISPTIFGALLSQRKVLDMKKRFLAENTKSSMSSSLSVPLQNVIEPEWLRGKKAPIEAVLDSFLEVQSHFKELYAENYEAYSRLKKEKARKAESGEHATSQKKYKQQDNITDESTSVKFEDDEQSISIKEENEHHERSSNESCETFSQSTKNNGKKKIFKI